MQAIISPSIENGILWIVICVQTHLHVVMGTIPIFIYDFANADFLTHMLMCVNLNTAVVQLFGYQPVIQNILV